MPIHQTDFGRIEVLEFGDAGADRVVLLLLHATATGPGSLARLGKALGDAGYRVLIPALNRYGGTRVSEDGAPLERNVRVANWALETFAGKTTVVFGQSMGGLTAVLTALSPSVKIDGLVLYEPMVMRALDPDDPIDMRERDWDRALVDAVERSLGTDRHEAAMAAFIEAWNEVAWDDIPSRTRETILGDALGLAEEMRAVNQGCLSPLDIAKLEVPTMLLGGDASPALAGRILDRLEQRLPNRRREVLAGLGHMGPVMAPSRIAELIVEFLE
jgi:pimeloyl-ACP methyl ester carboxylesterase